jgi:hypothetical protein
LLGWIRFGGQQHDLADLQKTIQPDDTTPDEKATASDIGDAVVACSLSYPLNLRLIQMRIIGYQRKSERRKGGDMEGNNDKGALLDHPYSPYHFTTIYSIEYNGTFSIHDSSL